MDKIVLEKFIQKYNLSGNVESVLWTYDESDSTLSVRGTTDDRQVFVFVNTDKINDLPENEYPIYDTSQLIRLLSVLENNIDLAVENSPVDGTPSSIIINDDQAKIKFVLSNKSILGDIPSEPPSLQYDMTIQMDKEFINRFVKAASSLSGVDTFTVVDDTFVVGYSDMNTTRVSIRVNHTGELSEPMTFSSKYLSAILIANKEWDEGTIQISSNGIMKVHFPKMVFESRYYLPRNIS